MTNINQDENQKIEIEHQKSEHTMGMQKSKYIQLETDFARMSKFA